MALDFPASPVDGQTFSGYVYSASAGLWYASPESINGIPAGSIMAWPTATAPTNWLICDGTAVSRSTYASLFAAIGTTYGVGNGSTTFNLPDLRGRVPVGRNAGTFGTLGATGGAETVTLTNAQLPDIPINIRRFDGDANDYLGGSSNPYGITTPYTTGGTEYNIAQTRGGGGAHNNLQPYQVVNYIIKFTNGDTAGDSQLTTRVGTLETTVGGIGTTNTVLNSAFEVWQRGTSGTPTSAATRYVADRWETFRAAYAAGLTVSRQASGLTGIQYCARIQRTAANTGVGALVASQAFETVDSIPLAGKTVTFSFFARAGANYSSASNILQARLITGTGTDQNLAGGFTGAVDAISQTPTLTTSWQRFSYTTTLSSSATQVGVNFQYTPVGTAGTNDYFEVTGVQVEQGSAATTYRRQTASYQAELAACQRYYWRISAGGGNYAVFAMGFALETTQIRYMFQPPVPLRIVPSSIEWTGTGSHYLNNSISGGDVTPTNIALTQSNSTTITLWVAAIGTSVAGRQYQLTNTPTNTNAFLGFSAEL